jgi:hypothetical protein
MGRLSIRQQFLLGLAGLLGVWIALVAGLLTLQHYQERRMAGWERLLATMERVRLAQQALGGSLQPLYWFVDTQRQGLSKQFKGRVDALQEEVSELRGRPGLGPEARQELAVLEGLAQDLRVSGVTAFQAEDPAEAQSLAAVARSFAYRAQDKLAKAAKLLRLHSRDRIAATRRQFQRVQWWILGGAGGMLLLATMGGLRLLGGARRRLVGHARSVEEAAEALDLAAGGAHSVTYPQNEARQGARELLELLEELESSSSPRISVVRHHAKEGARALGAMAESFQSPGAESQAGQAGSDPQDAAQQLREVARLLRREGGGGL